MLSKPPVARVIPGSKGKAAVPYRPAYTVCGASPAQGYWRQTCSDGRMQAPVDGAVQLPQNATIVGYETVSDVTYVIYSICRSTFVQTAPPGPVICKTYPEQRAEPEVLPSPMRVVYDNVFAWDAGANSIDELDGDVAVQLTMDRAIGVVVGFTAGRDRDLNDLTRVSHGLYFHQSEGGRMQACAMERGRRVTAARLYDRDDIWIVRRAGSVVEYVHNSVSFHRSQVHSTGPVLVGCAIFGSGDFIE